MSRDRIFTSFPLLQTARLTLREIVSADQADLFTLYCDPQVTRYLDIDPLTEAAQAAELVDLFAQRFAAGGGLRWAISWRDTPGLVGTCGYNCIDRDNHWAEIGYDLSLAHQHRGIMTEALMAILDYGFGSAGLHRIEANVTAGNEASVRVLERLGFAHEGTLRERVYKGGSYRDVLCFGRLRDSVTGV